MEEAAQVRADFGYPIMVTPLSQFVGSQAAINVIVGERYKQVTDQTIEYAMGIWGKEGTAFMDANVKEKILNRPRAKEIAERPIEVILCKTCGVNTADKASLMKKCCHAFSRAKKMSSACTPPDRRVTIEPMETRW